MAINTKPLFLKITDRKQDILQTAAKLFKERGYQAVTMRDLAAEMAIKAASLYNHISSKQEILQDIVIAMAQQFTQAMNNIITSEQTSLEQLKAVVNLHVAMALRNPNEMAALNSDWMHLQEQKDTYFQLRETYEANFRQILHSGINEGEIKSVNVDVMVFSMLTTLRSLYLWIPKQDQLDENTLTEDFYKILVQGIAI